MAPLFFRPLLVLTITGRGVAYLIEWGRGPTWWSAVVLAQRPPDCQTRGVLFLGWCCFPAFVVESAHAKKKGRVHNQGSKGCPATVCARGQVQDFHRAQTHGEPAAGIAESGSGAALDRARRWTGLLRHCQAPV